MRLEAGSGRRRFFVGGLIPDTAGEGTATRVLQHASLLPLLLSLLGQGTILFGSARR